MLGAWRSRDLLARPFLTAAAAAAALLFASLADATCPAPSPTPGAPPSYTVDKCPDKGLDVIACIDKLAETNKAPTYADTYSPDDYNTACNTLYSNYFEPYYDNVMSLCNDNYEVLQAAADNIQEGFSETDARRLAAMRTPEDRRAFMQTKMRFASFNTHTHDDDSEQFSQPQAERELISSCPAAVSRPFSGNQLPTSGLPQNTSRYKSIVNSITKTFLKGGLTQGSDLEAVGALQLSLFTARTADAVAPDSCSFFGFDACGVASVAFAVTITALEITEAQIAFHDGVIDGAFSDALFENTVSTIENQCTILAEVDAKATSTKNLVKDEAAATRNIVTAEVAAMREAFASGFQVAVDLGSADTQITRELIRSIKTDVDKALADQAAVLQQILDILNASV